MHVPDPRIGTVLHDRYLVLERTTEGSMGVLYRGERVTLKRPVAIKFLSEGYAATREGIRRFEVEARAMSRLAHPNCVPVIDFGLDDGAPYLVMDFITGRTLRQVLVDEGRLPAARAIAIVRQVLAGLTHAHANQIIHRDVKPENILVTPVEGHGEHVSIVDFGLAKLRDEGSITTGLAVGTPGYMSPEQTVGGKVDERADVYAAGIILYELLAGQKPFRAKSPFDVMKMHREIPAPPLDVTAPDLTVSRRLEAVVQKALAKAPADRFPSTAAFLTALETTPEAQGKTEAPRSRRRPLVLAAAGIVAVLALVWIWRQSGAEGGASRPVVMPPPDAQDDATPAEPETPDTPPPVPEEPADVAKLRAQGGANAIRALEALRKRPPRRAAVYHALGNLYAEQRAWTSAVDAYANALAIDPAYRSDPRLIGYLVDALADDKAYLIAGRLIQDFVRDAALPRLQEASRSSNQRLRGRARGLTWQIKNPR